MHTVECADYGTGSDLHRTTAPNRPLDVAKSCDDLDARKSIFANDLRILPGSAIKQIAAQKERLKNSTGIRIIGAIFCDELDLIGLEIDQSLVLDRGVFVHDINGRGFRTHGDLSVDDSLILRNLWLSRSRIDGTIFGSKALIKGIDIFDSKIQGSILFRDSLVLEPALFDTVDLTGELSLRNSFFTYFLLQFSKVGAELDLTNSQARCAYLVRKSEIGGLFAVNAGFGTASPSGTSFFNWRKSKPYYDLIGIAHAYWPDEPLANDNDCGFYRIAFPGAFHLSDTKINHSLCFRSFHWLLPEAGSNGTSYVSFDDVDVGTIAFIDLALDKPWDKPDWIISGDETSQQEVDWRKSPSPPNIISTQRTASRSDGEWIAPPLIFNKPKREFEIVGFGSHSLIFNFSEDPGNYDLSLNGLKFDHVYTAQRKANSEPGDTLKCGYDPEFYKRRPIDTAERLLDNSSDPGSNLVSPPIADVTRWLDRNTVETTQPFTVFADAFANDGSDRGAKDFQVAKATTELGYRACTIFATLCYFLDMKASTQTTSADKSHDSDPFWRAAMRYIGDVVVGAFGFLLWLLADHGFHPEKVVWFVGGALLLFFAIFWVFLRVVAITPEKKDNTIRPIGFAFLFDRLLPAYQIRQDHYNIQTYYKRVRRRDLPNHLPDAIKTLKYFWRHVSVVKAEEKDIARAEWWLDILKVIGLILAIFLVAAINALVNH
jgi:hypothetical protein